MNQYMRRLWQMKVVKFDLMKDYRETIPIEEQVSAVASWIIFNKFIAQS